jgi:hypothetical protein
MTRAARVRAMLLVCLAAMVASACGSGGLLSDDGGDTELCADIDLRDYADTSSQVRLTLEGPIVAREENIAVRIVIDAGFRRFHLLEGYEDLDVGYQAEDFVDFERFDNDINAYREFIGALRAVGFADCKELRGDIDPDGSGECPTNRRMAVELYDENEQVIRLWWADCDGGRGTLAGNAEIIQGLFEAQIPNYEALTGGIEF